MGQNMMEAHFGLADATKIDRIKLTWPSGIEQIITNLDVNQILRVVEK